MATLLSLKNSSNNSTTFGALIESKLRLAKSAADARRIAEINVKAWKRAYKGLMPDTLLNKLSLEGFAAGWTEKIADGTRVWLIEYHDEIIGFASVGDCKDRDANECTAELFTIYLEPDFVGMKFGKTLVQRALYDLKEANYTECVVWFMEGNKQAKRFYESVGFTDSHKEKKITVMGDEISEMQYHIRLK